MHKAQTSNGSKTRDAGPSNLHILLASCPETKAQSPRPKDPSAYGTTDGFQTAPENSCGILLFRFTVP